VDEVDSALLQDDQCRESDCVLNALQMKSRLAESELADDFQDVMEDADEAEEEEEELEWLKDISVKQKNHFKHLLSPLQKPIVAEYKALSVLDKFSEYMMGKVENATGQKIEWNKKAGLLQSDEEIRSFAPTVQSSARRCHGLYFALAAIIKGVSHDADRGSTSALAPKSSAHIDKFPAPAKRCSAV